jgi:predicted transcriptional regulator
MAIPEYLMTKVTVTLSDDAIEALNRTAKRLGKPKSEVVRMALRDFAEHGADRLTPAEIARRKAILERIRGIFPTRPQSETEAELRAIRRARRTGGRRTPVE